MRKQMLLVVLIFLMSLNLFGQKKLPKDLTRAVRFLEKDCPDSVKNRIKYIHKDSLIYAVYPFAKSMPYQGYQTVYDWTSAENGNPELTRYLEDKGIFDEQAKLLLDAFRQYLLNGKINENEILAKYAEQQRIADEKHRLRYSKDSIDGVYIPKDLLDCFAQLNAMISDSIKMEAKRLEENDFVSKTHLGLGMWMRNNWRLWGGSRLSSYFNELGIHHPDDMTGIILVSYYRSLNQLEVSLDEQVRYHQAYWENAEKASNKSKQEEFSAYKIGDTLEFRYNKGYVSKRQERRYEDDTCIAKGIVMDRNEQDCLIRVRLISACDKRGIVWYDNDGDKVYDPKTAKWRNPPKRIIKRIRAKQEQWFAYSDWEH